MIATHSCLPHPTRRLLESYFCRGSGLFGKALSRSRRTAQLHVFQYSRSAVQNEAVKTLNSLNNPYVKHCSKLRTNSRYRAEEGAALLAGVIPLLELKREIPSLHLKSLLWSGSRDLIPEELGGAETFLVTDDILRKVSGLQTVSGLHAVAEICLPRETDFTRLPKGQLKRCLVCDGIQDPGNLGTLLRTAVALGWQGAFFLEGCCDPFNDKALRAGRGATFKLPLVFGNWEKLDSIMKYHGMACYAADSRSDGDFSRGNGTRKVQTMSNQDSSSEGSPYAIEQLEGAIEPDEDLRW